MPRSTGFIGCEVMGANSEGDKNMSGSIVRRTCLGDGDRLRFGHMPWRCEDVQRFGPQTFETHGACGVSLPKVFFPHIWTV